MVVASVHARGSRGVARYVSLLAEALAREGIAYRPRSRPLNGEPAHFHLANSSRGALWQAPRRRERFVVTVHDVVPRTRALLPLYRVLAYPFVAGRAGAVVVHSRFAADLLVREARRRPRRLEVIPHGAARPREHDRLAARRALGWPEGALLAVLPGVIKAAKLVREAIAATAGAPGWTLALAGEVADPGAARAAQAHGMLVLPSPDADDYERAIVAADCVLCLRSGSVGETNGPLLDAIGAGRAVLATATGAIPETAGEVAIYCEGEVTSIRAGLAILADPAERAAREQGAAARAEELSWAASAAAHGKLFQEVFRD